MAVEVGNDAKLIHRLRTLEWLPKERIVSLAKPSQPDAYIITGRFSSIEGEDAAYVYLLLSGVARLSLYEGLTDPGFARRIG